VNVRATPLILLVGLFAACASAGATGPSGTAASAEPTHVFRSVVPSLSTVPAVPAPCPSSTPAGGVEVALFVAPGGGCIRPDQLRQFRCADHVDPVIEAAGLRFLGGRFAMLAPGLPAGAGLIGHGAGEDLFIVPGDRPTLYVRTADGRISRWLTLDPAVAAMPHVLVVGDSITVGSRAAIVRSLPGWTASFHAKVGRTTEQGITAARTVHDIGGLDAVVVELGTNDSTAEGFPDRIARMLAVVGRAKLVVWVTVHRDLTIVPELNDDIVRAMAALPNGAVADWNAVVTPDDIVSDGVHPNVQGRKLMASLLSGLLAPWRDAATGAGATACAATVAAG
jgi:lysophospholipase L1-like esterase